jgi:superfamily II DNA or RNA helicase
VIGLRPYQQIAEGDIRHAMRAHKRVLLVMPTGSGKTVLFASICAGAAAKGRRIYIIAHRAELLDQISSTLEQFAVEHKFIAAGYPSGAASVQVCSVQTLVRRLDRVSAPDMLIIDEAHHCVGANTWGRILAAWPSAYVLGVTATPHRLSGEGLGEVFQSMVMGPTTAQLVQAGYLVRPRIFAPPTVSTDGLHMRAGEYVQAEVAARMSQPSIVGDAIAHYRTHAAGKPAILFGYSLDHIREMAVAFRAAGYRAESIDGGLARELRNAVVHDFRSCELQILCSCDLVSEGFDVPGAHCGILLRPTASEGLYLQQIGRLLRAADWKSEAIILDHVGNTQRHGHPLEDRDWSLDGTASARKRAEKKLSVRVCARCFAASSGRAKQCIECGTAFPIAPREVDARAGELIEIELQRRDSRREVGTARDLAALQAIEKQRGYRPGWAAHVYAARQRRAGA